MRKIINFLFQSIAAQTVFTNFLILCLGFASSIFLSRQLGPEGRGEIAVATVWFQTLVYLGSFGIQEASAYYAAIPHSNTNSVLSNALILSMIQTIILIPFGHIILPAVLIQQRTIVIVGSQILLIAIPIALLTLNGVNVFRAKLLMIPFNLSQLIIPTSTVIAIVYLATNHLLTFLNVILVNIILYVLLLIVIISLLLKYNLWDCFQLDIKLMKQMLQFGGRVQMGSISQLANLRLDQLLMTAFLPATELGLYVVAVSAANIPRAVSSAFRTIIAPTIAREEITKSTIDMIMIKVHRFWLINIMIGIILAFLIPVAIPIVFGADFRDSIIPAEILISATICLGGKELLTGIAYGLGLPAVVSKAEFLSLLTTLTGLIVLLPSFGIIGAAITTLIAYSVSLIFLAYRLHSEHRVSPKFLFSLSLADLVEFRSYLFGFIRNELL